PRTGLPVRNPPAAGGAPTHLPPAVPAGYEALPPAAMIGFAFPADTSLAVLRLAGAGLFDRNPVIIAAHLGGVLPWLRERIGLWADAIPPVPGQPQLARPGLDYLDRIYVDTVGYVLAP